MAISNNSRSTQYFCYKITCFFELRACTVNAKSQMEYFSYLRLKLLLTNLKSENELRTKLCKLYEH